MGQRDRRQKGNPMNIDAVQNALSAIDHLSIDSVDELFGYNVPDTITHDRVYHIRDIELLSDDPAAVNILCTKLILKKLDELAG